MSTQVTEFKCPACTAPLRYAQDTGRLECDYCGSSYTVEEAEAFSEEKQKQAEEAFQKEAEAAKADAGQWDAPEAQGDWGADAAHLKTYHCPSCGAELICDEISDPHNLGAIIRTAYCAGAHGVIIPKRRSAGLTSIVAKTSAGAVSHMKVARVPNIPALLKDLKKQGIWVFGTAADGTTGLYQADLKGPAAIVIGSEGDGMTRLAAENCDFLVSIPMSRLPSTSARRGRQWHECSKTSQRTDWWS